MTACPPPEAGVAIAVVGMAARLPGAPTLADFRRLVRSGRGAVRRFDGRDLQEAGIAPQAEDRYFVPAKGFVEEADCFDLDFFGITPALARAMDPQHRLFLECSWQALEDAGLTQEPAGCRIGVFAGASSSSSYYHDYAARDPGTLQALDPFQIHLVNQPSALPNQVSFHFDLTGPSVAVQTACSSGLATIVSACQSLLDGQCDAALAGAVTLSLPLVGGYAAPPGSILSPSGACRPFDAAADGTVPGDGVAAVVLKRLEDARADGDRIHAVIRGYGMTNDGARKVGFSAPSADGQAAAIATAIAMAEVSPQDIAFIETHGTGTALGDAIELSALSEVFASCRNGSIALGAVKAQLGHLDVAAGMAGFIKAVVAVQDGLIPPVAGASHAHPDFRLEATPFRIPMQQEAWPATTAPRLAGVSSFGMGGTNLHVVIEQAPARATAVSVADGARWSVLPVSAPSAEGLDSSAQGLAAFLAGEGAGSLADVAASLARRGRVFDHRLAVVAADSQTALHGLRAAGSRRRVLEEGSLVFAFTGQGSLQPGVARDLYRCSPSFAAALDLCRAELAELGCDIDSCLFGNDRPSGAEPPGTAIAQPAIFAFGYALASMLQAWGLAPSAAIGHSLGEYLALCLAGVLERRTALRLVLARGEAMQPLDGGAMLAVAAPAEAVLDRLPPGVEIAAFNGPAQIVVAGPEQAVAAVEQSLRQAGTRTHRIASRWAFHTALMEPALAAVRTAAADAGCRPPRLPVVSTLTGRFLPAGEAPEAGYFADHARAPVRFGGGVEALVAAGHCRFIEIGAGSALTGLVRALGAAEASAVPALPRPEEDAVEQVLQAAAALWTSGAPLDWRKVDAVAPGTPLSLPPYPFKRTYCWAGARRHEVPTTGGHAEAQPPRGDEALDATEVVQSLLARCLGLERMGAEEDYHRLGGDSLTAVRAADLLARRFGVALRPGDLVQAPTPRRLAALIAARQGGSPAAQGVVVKGRSGDGRRPPLVLFHPIGGTLHLYGELLVALPEEQPILLVQALPFAGAGPQPDSIEDMAAHYLAALQIEAGGQVHFAGASFGGLLAFEAARQWRRQGGSPVSVIMLDSPPPGAVATAAADEADMLSFMGRLLGQSLESRDLRRLDPEAQRRRLVEMLSVQLPEGLDEAEVASYVDVFRANARAMNDYRPAASDAAPVVLVVAECRDPGQPADPVSGWSSLARRGLSVVPVAGGHLSMLAEPHVRATAAAIQAVLSDARRQAAQLQGMAS